MRREIGRTDDFANKIIAATFPDYKGKKVQINSDYMPDNLRSYWDGGSRDYWAFYDMSNEKTYNVGSNHPYYEPNNPSKLNPDLLPAHILIVCHTIFCGKDLGITIYGKPEAFTKLIAPSTVELTEDETKVLSSYDVKSSYAGISNYRAHSIGFSKEKWDFVQRSLCEKGLVDKRGALTLAGKNIRIERKIRSHY